MAFSTIHNADPSIAHDMAHSTTVHTAHFSDGLGTAAVESAVAAADFALAMERHEFRRERLEELTTRPTIQPQDQQQPRSSLNGGTDLKELISTMDSAISTGKMTLRQRLEEAMSQSARRQARVTKASHDGRTGKDSALSTKDASLVSQCETTFLNMFKSINPSTFFFSLPMSYWTIDV